MHRLPAAFGPGSLLIDARRHPRPLTRQLWPGDVCNLGPGNLCYVANNCRCGASVEGVGVCVVGAPNFCTRRTCFSSRDCASDSVCVLAGSCCGAGASVCMRVCPAG